MRNDAAAFHKLGGYESNLYYLRSDVNYGGTLLSLSDRNTEAA